MEALWPLIVGIRGFGLRVQGFKEKGLGIWGLGSRVYWGYATNSGNHLCPAKPLVSPRP